MNTGTAGGHMETVVGEGAMFMVGCHIAHDCVVGDRVIFANGATLGGHVTVGNDVFIGLGSSGAYRPQLLGGAGDGRFVVGAFMPSQSDGGAGNDVLVVECLRAPSVFNHAGHGL